MSDYGNNQRDSQLLPRFISLSDAPEIRITDPVTGGQKGSKLERFDLIPVEPLEALARVYGVGATKYADDNWRKGYSWRLSFAALMRHAWAFWRGEETDKESGQPHMAHAAWHCFTLLWFAQHRRAQDDRYETADQSPCTEVQAILDTTHDDHFSVPVNRPTALSNAQSNTQPKGK